MEMGRPEFGFGFELIRGGGRCDREFGCRECAWHLYIPVFVFVTFVIVVSLLYNIKNRNRRIDLPSSRGTRRSRPYTPKHTWDSQHEVKSSFKWHELWGLWFVLLPRYIRGADESDSGRRAFSRGLAEPEGEAGIGGCWETRIEGMIWERSGSVCIDIC
jgi:hypothetical protein